MTRPHHNRQQADIDRARKARDDLRRLDQQNEKIFGAAPRHDPPPEADDAIEVWAKRSGRALGFLFAAYLIWHLISTYVIPR